MSSHVAEWNKIWQSRFDVGGNCDIAGKIHAVYYYLLSSMPVASTYEDDGWPFFGISPGSLANDDSHVCFLYGFVPKRNWYLWSCHTSQFLIRPKIKFLWGAFMFLLNASKNMICYPTHRSARWGGGPR
jgi:hypothetical protein